jgi:hypothetical protein
MGFDPRKRPVKLSLSVDPEFFKLPRLQRVVQMGQADRELRAFLRELRKYAK